MKFNFNLYSLMKVVKYILGVSFILSGLVSIFETNFIAGLISIILGALILPPFSDNLKEKFKFWQNKGLRYVAYIFLFFALGLSIQKNKSDKIAESPEGIAESFVKSHAKNPLISTIDSIKKVEKIFDIDEDIVYSGNSEFVKQKDGSIIYSPKFNKRDSLYKDYQLSNKKILDYDLVFNINNGKVSSVKASVLHYGDKDRVLYDSINLPKVSSWLNKKEIEKMIVAKTKLQDAEKKLAEIEEKKKDWEKNCISAWDGSCPKLVNALKENLKDPESFEHIETYIKYGDKYVTVVMKYRAKNSFGGYNVEAVTGQVSYDCEVLGISQ